MNYFGSNPLGPVRPLKRFSLLPAVRDSRGLRRILRSDGGYNGLELFAREGMPQDSLDSDQRIEEKEHGRGDQDEAG